MKHRLKILIVAILFLSGCSSGNNKNNQTSNNPDSFYNNFYEIFVGAFYDSDGNGHGDFNGITKQLDYLNGKNVDATLGIDGIWLMPIMKAKSYHKYDVINYKEVDPDFGTMQDFEILLEEAKSRDIDIIIDLVLNHTSTDNPWFQSAIKSLGIEPCGQEKCIHEVLCREHNPYVGYYNFSQTYRKGFHDNNMPEGWYYEGVFWDGMPDLNLDNEDLRKDIIEICDFWIEKGVAGFRMDAVTMFYQEQVDKNVEFLSWLKQQYPNNYIVAEAWTSNYVIPEYYKSGINSFFNFPFSGQGGTIATSVRLQDGANFARKVEEWQTTITTIEPNAIDAPFLSNHDQPRSVGYFQNDTTKQKMAFSLYYFMPGNPFIYYGEEIGMSGYRKDEDKRQPMVWSSQDKTGIPNPVEGTTQTQSLAKGVKEQLEDKDSLLRFYQRVIQLKKQYPSIAKSKVQAIDVKNDAVGVMMSTYENTKLFIVHNIGTSEAKIELDASIFKDVGIDGFVSVGEEQPILQDNRLLLPANTTLILKEKKAK